MSQTTLRHYWAANRPGYYSYEKIGHTAILTTALLLMRRDNDDKQWEALRRRMTDVQLAQRGIRDPRVLHAMQSVPRHTFLPPQLQSQAYDDTPLPIGKGQTISQPYIVARVTELLRITHPESATVLEVGAGCGYQAAVLAQLATHVFAVECVPGLVQTATRYLCDLGIENVKVITADGGAGLQEFAPFDAILMSAAAPRVPSTLFAQLADGGRLVAPVGSRNKQQLQRWVKNGHLLRREKFTQVRFVPLTGKWGF